MIWRSGRARGFADETALAPGRFDLLRIKMRVPNSGKFGSVPVTASFWEQSRTPGAGSFGVLILH
jgi:hypothetical protein